MEDAKPQYKFYYIDTDYLNKTVPVVIPKSATVDELQTCIQQSNMRYKDIQPPDLDLFKVDVLDDDDRAQNVLEKLKALGEPLRPTYRVAKYYESDPPEETIHLLVKVISNDISIPRSVPMSRRLTTLQEEVKNFLNILRPEIQGFLQSSPRLPCWSPPDTVNNETREFYKARGIPAPKNNKPSLLFDNLLNHPPNSIKDSLFMGEKTVLCNVSGSGKTLALLTGLSDHWGFYFTAAQGPDAVGSNDIASLIKGITRQEGWIHDVFIGQPDQSHIRRQSIQNETIVRREMAKVLFARWTIFKLFIEVAIEIYGTLPEHLKTDWMLFQSAPSMRRDMFYELITTCLQDVDEKLLYALGIPSLRAIFGVDHSTRPFYYVLDEVQAAEEEHIRCFVDKDGEHPRPILRPIMWYLTEHDYPIIVSGTGISLESITTVLASGVGKSLEWRKLYEMDDFSKVSRQEKCIRYYLPVEFLASETGWLLLHRMWDSCRGRPRFTMRVLEEILGGTWGSNRPVSPLRILNACIKAWTGCEALAYHSETILKEPVVGEFQIDTFKWKKLQRVKELESILEDRIYMWLTMGKILTLDAKETKIVEYGLGRFVSTQRDHDDQDAISIREPQQSISIGEPLALVGICHHFFEKRSLARRLATHIDLNKGDGFEVVTMLALTQLLQNQICLRHLVSFTQKPGWSRETAQIISQSLNDGVVEELSHSGFLPESVFDPRLFPTRAETPEQVVRWLTGEIPTLWCIPGHMMGPDLMTRAKLSNGDVILIMVQVKCRGLHTTKGNSLPAHDTEAAINSLSPSSWFSGTINPKTSAKVKLEQQGKIERMVSEINKYKLLKLIASHPLVCNLDSSNPGVQSALSALEKHPGHLATLEFEEIVKAYSQIEGGGEVVRRLKRKEPEGEQ